MKKVFISQPMNGKTDDEILKERCRIIKNLKKELGKIEVIDSIIKENPKDNVNIPLWYLAKSLELLSEADIVYFAKGYDKYRGCIVEHMCAIIYDMKIIMEEAE